MVAAKHAFESLSASFNFSILHYHAVNWRVEEPKFFDVVNLKEQTIFFSGFSVHHQNRATARGIKDLQDREGSTMINPTEAGPTPSVCIVGLMHFAMWLTMAIPPQVTATGRSIPSAVFAGVEQEHNLKGFLVSGCQSMCLMQGCHCARTSPLTVDGINLGQSPSHAQSVWSHFRFMFSLLIGLRLIEMH